MYSPILGIQTRLFEGCQSLSICLLSFLSQRCTWDFLVSLPVFSLLVIKGVKVALTKKGEQPSLPVCFLAGSSAGVGFWGLFYPLEIIKSRMQVRAHGCCLESHLPPTDPNTPPYGAPPAAVVFALIVLYITSKFFPAEAWSKKKCL